MKEGRREGWREGGERQKWGRGRGRRGRGEGEGEGEDVREGEGEEKVETCFESKIRHC